MKKADYKNLKQCDSNFLSIDVFYILIQTKSEQGWSLDGKIKSDLAFVLLSAYLYFPIFLKNKHDCSGNKLISVLKCSNFPGESVAQTLCSQCRGAWVQSLVRELDPTCYN